MLSHFCRREIVLWYRPLIVRCSFFAHSFILQIQSCIFCSSDCFSAASTVSVSNASISVASVFASVISCALFSVESAAAVSGFICSGCSAGRSFYCVFCLCWSCASDSVISFVFCLLPVFFFSFCLFLLPFLFFFAFFCLGGEKKSYSFIPSNRITPVFLSDS